MAEVLVVEDTASMLLLYGAMLRGLGHTVHLAKDATEALSMLRANVDVSVVISDYDLGPGKNGSELLERCFAIRNVGGAIITASPHVVRSRPSGVRVHSKPLNTESLGAIVAELSDG